MKRFQLGLKREARPQRYGGEELDWGLQITNEKSSRLWGWRGEGAWTSEADYEDTSNTRLAGSGGGGTLKLIPKERKQKRCSLLLAAYLRWNAE